MKLIETEVRRPKARLPLSLVPFVVVAALGVSFCFAFPFSMGPSFKQMFATFHVEPSLASRLAMTDWFPILLALPSLAALMTGLGPARNGGRAPLLVKTSAALGLFGALACLVAAYATPITMWGDGGLDLPPGRAANGNYLGPGRPR